MMGLLYSTRLWFPANCILHLLQAMAGRSPGHFVIEYNLRPFTCPFERSADLRETPQIKMEY